MVSKIPGTFITGSTSVISIYSEKLEKIEKDIDEKLIECFDVGKENAQTQGFIFPIQKISEIAVRAISPGINDPNTAIHCLHIMGIILSEVAIIEKGYLFLMEDGKSSGAFEVVDFEQVPYHSFYQVIHYGKEDLSVMVGLIRALRIIQERVSSNNEEVLKSFTEYLWQKVEPEGKVHYERKWLEDEKLKLKCGIQNSSK